MAKLFLILGVVAAALIVCARVAGLISNDIASDSLGRVLGIVATLALAAAAISFIVGKPRPTTGDKTPKGPGPKF